MLLTYRNISNWQTKNCNERRYGFLSLDYANYDLKKSLKQLNKLSYLKKFIYNAPNPKFKNIEIHVFQKLPLLAEYF